MILILLLALVSSQPTKLEDLKSRIESGKAHYNTYASISNCNEKVMQSMLKKCDDMNEDIQSEFALKLTNCHLERVGFPLYDCSPKNLTNCYMKMDQNTFLAYTQFFTHAFDLCVYLSFSAWQSKTSATIQGLSDSAEKALYALDLAEKTAKEIQMEQEYVQRWLGKIYDGISEIGYLEEMILGEVFDIKSILFYIGSFILCMLLTSCPETSNARVKLLWLFCLEILMEKFLYWYFPYLRHISGTIRLIFLVLCITVIVWSVKTHKQYDKMTYEILKETLTKIGKSALESITPRYSSIKQRKEKRYMPSPLKEQCSQRLRKIPEVHYFLEEDIKRIRRKSDGNLAELFMSITSKSAKKEV
ncbi:unnamed protein product [Blepharisma stoltei]|uniref:Uncharacterized protein n=1 Tax=Blepharisma stoltei TaxID=1481888 RepID=A0AAU9K3B7_9CILI|nr:unnamed protein product [Blepharisma stoltei]